MTATWSVNKENTFTKCNHSQNNQPLMAVVKNNAYHYDLEFAVTRFIHAGIDTFSTTSLREAIQIRTNLLQMQQSFNECSLRV